MNHISYAETYIDTYVLNGLQIYTEDKQRQKFIYFSENKAKKKKKPLRITCKIRKTNSGLKICHTEDGYIGPKDVDIAGGCKP